MATTSVRIRLANSLIALAGGVALAGLIGFVLAAQPWGWDDLAEGVRYYASHREVPGLLLVLLAVLTVLGIALLPLMVRGRARFRAEAARRAEAPPHDPQAAEKRLERIRRRLDQGLTRARHSGEGTLDALLGALVDLEASELRVAPGEMLEVVTAIDGDQHHPLATLAAPQRARLTEQACLVSGAKEGAPGELELRSSHGADPIQVILEGPVLRLRLLTPEDRAAAASGREPTRPRVRGTVIRLEQAHIGWRTGEWSQTTYRGVDDTTDDHSGMITGLDPSGEAEIAPLVRRRVPRPLTGIEAWLRLAAGTVLASVLLLFFTPALAAGVTWAFTGRLRAPWKEVAIEVTSRPTGARVLVGTHPRGTTPILLREACKGRLLRLLVEAPGHLAWEWSGLCPARGLRLEAELRPLR